MRNGILPLITLVILSFPASTRSQVTQNWARGYAAFLPSNAKMAMDGSGNIYVAGNISNGFSLIKYNSAGTGQWSTTAAAETNGLVGIGTDNAGNVYAVSNTGPAIAVTAFGPSGTQLWTTNLQVDNDGMRNAIANVMTVDASGNVYVGGQITVGVSTGHTAYMTVKVSSGVQKYVGIYEGTAIGYKQFASINAIACDNAGNVYVSGTAYNAHEYLFRAIGAILIRRDSSFDMTTIKYDSSGHTVWTNNYNGGYDVGDYGFAVTVDPSSGNVYALGQSTVNGLVGDVVAYSSGGSQLWIYQNSSFPNDDAIAVDPSGNIITGGTNKFNISKYSSSGSLTWSYSNPGIILSGNQYGGNLSMALDKNGNTYITSPANNFTEYYTAEISSGGSFVWSTTYGAGGSGGSSAIAIYTPVSRFGLITYPQINVAGTAGNNTNFTTLQYSYRPVLVLAAQDSSTALDNSSATTPDNRLSNFESNLSNFPNPFRGNTSINYTLANDSHVTLQVFDQSGKPVATVFEGDQTAGPHYQPFNADRLAAGVYFYRIIANSGQQNFTQAKTMAILP